MVRMYVEGFAFGSVAREVVMHGEGWKVSAFGIWLVM